MPNLTIKDIARISGCSVSTISRVINDRPDVRPETKEHVLKVMREAGFVPNTNARQLKIQQSAVWCSWSKAPAISSSRTS